MIKCGITHINDLIQIHEKALMVILCESYFYFLPLNPIITLTRRQKLHGAVNNCSARRFLSCPTKSIFKKHQTHACNLMNSSSGHIPIIARWSYSLRLWRRNCVQRRARELQHWERGCLTEPFSLCLTLFCVWGAISRSGGSPLNTAGAEKSHFARSKVTGFTHS